MPPAYKDNTGEFINRLRGACLEGLKRAAIFAHAECRKAVAESAGPVAKKRQRSTVAGEKGSQYTEYTRPSVAGEAPHKRTGIGGSNIVFETNDNLRAPAARVGVARAGIHMIYLELGTEHIAPRPWLLKTIMDNWRMIGQLAAIGGKGRLK